MNDFSGNPDQKTLPLPPGKIARDKFNKLWLFWGIGLLCGLAGQWSFARLPSPLNQASTASPPQSVANSLAVETLVAKPVDSYRETRSYTGTLIARRSSELGFERAGQLQQILVREGDRVRSGDPLARLDTDQLQAKRRELLAQRAQAVAQVQELKAGPRQETISAAQAAVRNINEQLKLARLKSQRREMLYAEGALDREQLEQSSSEARSLQARLEEAQSQLKELQSGTRPEQIDAQEASITQIDASLAQLEIELENSILKAPFSGEIAVRHADEGRVISASQPVVRLVESHHLEARVSLPVGDAEAILIGSEQQLTIGQKTYKATVTSILPEVNTSTGTVTVVLHLKTAVDVLPGQTVTLQWSDTVSESGYWLPATALVKGQRGLWSCYVLGEPAQTSGTQSFRVARRDVEVLHTDDAFSQGEAVRVLVRGTLEAGDRVIASGTHRLVPGQVVSLAN